MINNKAIEADVSVDPFREILYERNDHHSYAPPVIDLSAPMPMPMPMAMRVRGIYGIYGN